MTKNDLQQKKIALLGLGIEGLSTAAYFLKHHISFVVIDEKSEEVLRASGKQWEEGLDRLKEQQVRLVLGAELTSELLQEFDVIVRSPGISPSKSFFQDYTGDITSQTQLFLDWCPGKIIGVTGTKGKGTTASLIYEMLKLAEKDAYVGGNIGKPAFDFLDSMTVESIAVLELSSFQLTDVTKSPHISIMLMVTTDHVAFHGTLQSYHEAKRNIFRFQTADDMAIINPDYVASKLSEDVVKGKVVFVSRFAAVANGCFVQNNKIILRVDGIEEEVIAVPDILLPGAHNLENVCAAVMAAHACGVGIIQMQEVLRTFKGLEHRLELVREINGVRYYDDSIATNPESALAAIQSFRQPKVLILGGVTEGSDFTLLGTYISEDPSIKAIIGIGKEWPEIKEKITNEKLKTVEGLGTMQEVVQTAKKLASPGDVVLLSPACKSFDMFRSYKDRGEQFKKEVNLL